MNELRRLATTDTSFNDTSGSESPTAGRGPLPCCEGSWAEDVIKDAATDRITDNATGLDRSGDMP